MAMTFHPNDLFWSGAHTVHLNQREFLATKATYNYRVTTTPYSTRIKG